MSRQLRVQHLPARLAAADEIPKDFEVRPLGMRADVLAAIQRVAPDTDISDPAKCRIEGPDCAVEVELGDEDPCSGFTLVVDDGASTPFIVFDLLTDLGLQALDPEAPNGLFTLPQDSLEGLTAWQKYRKKLARK